ncbi:MFS efflux [Phlyctema vagabunda]|uniref:MFS efflux n=1 Tax=Phlyctema vagabunda TaxID=108571 RepID=A0ABR4P6W9_9HELO
MACGYILMVCHPPFAAVVAAFFFIGFGLAINLSLGNVFASNLRNGTAMLGAMHGAYGIGGTVGPLIATGIVTNGLSWSRYYLLPLGMTAFNIFFSAWSFWNYEKESSHTNMDGTERIASTSKNNKFIAHVKAMTKTLHSKVVLLGALFIFAYQGAEVSISGWVVSFLIVNRNGNPSAVGYVTSGFWGGITLGRFLLSHLGYKIGEKRFVYGMTIGAIIFELLVWFVPNIVEEAVALVIVGLLLGPVYPCATHVFSKLISRGDQVSSLGIISAFGSSGGAVAPFTTGILAQAVGTFVMHPIAVGLFAVMIACWFGLPALRKRTD